MSDQLFINSYDIKKNYTKLHPSFLSRDQLFSTFKLQKQIANFDSKSYEPQHVFVYTQTSKLVNLKNEEMTEFLTSGGRSQKRLQKIDYPYGYTYWNVYAKFRYKEINQLTIFY
eukprot:403362270